MFYKNSSASKGSLVLIFSSYILRGGARHFILYLVISCLYRPTMTLIGWDFKMKIAYLINLKKTRFTPLGAAICWQKILLIRFKYPSKEGSNHLRDLPYASSDLLLLHILVSAQTKLSPRAAFLRTPGTIRVYVRHYGISPPSPNLLLYAGVAR